MMKRKHSTILGLDISTSSVGYCIFSAGSYIESGTIPLSKMPISLYEKAEYVQSFFYEHFSVYTFSHVVIEAPKKAFEMGKTSADVISMLSRFNGIISHLCFQIFSLEPIMISESSARKQAGIKVAGKGRKVQAGEYIISQPWFPESHIKLNKSNHLTNQCLDETDACVLCLAMNNNLKEKDVE